MTAKIKSALTDQNRVTVSDRGNPDICTVACYHKAFNEEKYPDICQLCRNAGIGCVSCKKILYDKVNEMLDPIREKRAYYEQRKGEVRDMILSGTCRVNEMGANMMAGVREAMKLSI